MSGEAVLRGGFSFAPRLVDSLPDPAVATEQLADLFVLVPDHVQGLDPTPALWDSREQLERVSKPGSLIDVITRVNRVALEVVDGLELEAERLRLLAPQPPGLALGRRDQPRPPVALAIRLYAHELDPRERARVVANLVRSVHTSLNDADEPRVEGQIQIGLVADKPSSNLLGDGTRRVVRRLTRAKF